MEQDTCTIGQSVVIKGELRAEENLTIEGQVEGTVDLNGNTLTIGPNARIRANVMAKVVTVQGKVDGDITAAETIEIRETAAVVGKLVAPRVGMAEGASFRGQVDMQRRETREANSGRAKGPQTAREPVAAVN